MGKTGLKIYSSLPYGVRVGIASLRGVQLRWQRYGHNTDQLVNEALEREYWSAERWSEWQRNRLSQILHLAATQVPYYRDDWEKRHHMGDRSSWKSLDNWPVLEKEAVRRNPKGFVSDAARGENLYETHTSGSTGTPLTLWNSRLGDRHWYALFEARCRRWYGVSRHDAWAILGGQLVTPVKTRKPPFWVWNAGLRQLYCSTYHLAPDLIPYYIQALIDHRVQYILGYPSALYQLALTVLEKKRSDLKLRVVIANAEPMYKHQRIAIETAFECPVRETYGMAERVAAGSECEHGNLHLWPEAGLVETFRENTPTKTGSEGDLVCTGLVNTAMPLIRYRVGDRGALNPEGVRCPCGRTLPYMIGIQGRSDDLLLTSDGRRIGRLDPVFKSGWPIRESQIVQESLKSIRVLIVPSEGYSKSIQEEITQQLRARLGPIEVEFEILSEIPRGSNGKFRSVICKLNSSDLNTRSDSVLHDRVGV